MTWKPPASSRDLAGPARKGEFPPLAVAIAAIILALLFFLMATLNLRHLQEVLNELQRERVVHLVDEVAERANREAGWMIAGLQGKSPLGGSQPWSDEVFSLQELLVDQLVGLARRIDAMDSVDSLNGAELRQLASDRHMEAILFLDPRGDLERMSGHVSPGFLSRLAAIMGARSSVVVQLFAPPHAPYRGYLGIRRKHAPGFLVLVPGPAGLQFQALGIALQKAVTEAIRSGDIVSFQVENAGGHLVFQWQGLDEGSPGAASEKPVSLQRSPAANQAEATRDSVDPVVAGISLYQAPYPLPDGTRGTALVRVNSEKMQRLVSRERLFILTVTLVISAFGALVMMVLHRLQNRHLRRYHQMHKRLEQSHRLAALGQLSAGVAHEVRNPLNAISIAAQRLQFEHQPGDQRRRDDFLRLIGAIRSEAGRMDRLVDDFLSLTRTPRLQRHSTQVVALCHRLVELLEPEAAAREIEIRLDPIPEELSFSVDRDRLTQVLLNVMRNAFDAIAGAGQVRIQGQAIRRSGAAGVQIRVTDSGCGMEPEQLAKIFDPFYTTKEKGSGLGLSLAHQIIKAHSGDLWVESEPGSGTTVVLELPVDA